MITTLILTAAAFVAGGAQAAAPAAAVLEREQQRIAYLTTGRLDDLAGVLSPTLTYTHSNASLDTKDQFLAKLRSGETVYKSIRHRDVQVRFPAPGVAILNGLSDIESVVSGKPQQVSLRFTLVYVQADGRWLMEAWQSTRPPAQP